MYDGIIVQQVTTVLSPFRSKRVQSQESEEGAWILTIFAEEGPVAATGKLRSSWKARANVQVQSRDKSGGGPGLQEVRANRWTSHFDPVNAPEAVGLGR